MELMDDGRISQVPNKNSFKLQELFDRGKNMSHCREGVRKHNSENMNPRCFSCAAAAQTETWTMEDGWERVHPPCLDLRLWPENDVKPGHGE